MTNLQWETIEDITFTDGLTAKRILVSRTRVPGGWLVMSDATTKTLKVTPTPNVSVTFIPDPEGTWLSAPPA